MRAVIVANPTSRHVDMCPTARCSKQNNAPGHQTIAECALSASPTLAVWSLLDTILQGWSEMLVPALNARFARAKVLIVRMAFG
ncbi:hypothetical protein ACU4GH_30470 [Bradyrhizobium betae]